MRLLNWKVEDAKKIGQWGSRRMSCDGGGGKARMGCEVRSSELGEEKIKIFSGRGLWFGVKMFVVG